MIDGTPRVLLVSDANLANLAAALRAVSGEPAVEPVLAPFGAVVPTLLDGDASEWRPRPDLCLVWTHPGSVLPSLSAALEGERVDPSALDAEVDRFTDLLAPAVSRSRWTLVATWTVPFGARGLGAIDLHDPQGIRALLLRANHRLLETLRDVPGAWVVDAAGWQAAGGTAAQDRRSWYAAKVPLPPGSYRAAAADIKAFLRAGSGRSRKIVLLDLDNTIWGGVVGETGWQGLRLGGHDPLGEAFVAFQKELKALSRRGVALGIVSKNDESVALEAIRRHPEMVLREDDFAGWRINWRDKATNIAELLEELRLGADAAVFLDDQPAERAQVQAAHPTILVPDWCEDPMGSVSRMDALACFDLLGISEEDAGRSRSYAADRERRTLRTSVGSLDEWLLQLGVSVRVEPLGSENLTRAAQLLNKTNQMNLTTRRLSEAELRSWAQGEGRACYTFRVADRFSDFGLTALLSMETRSGTARIVDFILSCRIMSRRIEEAMVHVAVRHARDSGATELLAVPLPTERNAPMLDFWRERSGFSREDDGVFRWDPADDYPAPRSIEMLRPLSVAG